jgi:Na+-translocating ferredoxin:NAD+ oxidoreductase RnfA subunit
VGLGVAVGAAVAFGAAVGVGVAVAFGVSVAATVAFTVGVELLEEQPAAEINATNSKRTIIAVIGLSCILNHLCKR